jgi:hypothetical protein
MPDVSQQPEPAGARKTMVTSQVATIISEIGAT